MNIQQLAREIAKKGDYIEKVPVLQVRIVLQHLAEILDDSKEAEICFLRFSRKLKAIRNPAPKDPRGRKKKIIESN